MDLIYSASTFFGNPIFFYSSLSIYFFIYTFLLFSELEKLGFSKERSLDVIFISHIFLAVPFFIVVRSYEIEFFLAYFMQLYFALSIVSLLVYLYIAGLFRKWSFFKLSDVFLINVSLLISLIFLSLSAYFFNYHYLIGFGIFFIAYIYLKTLYNNRFSRFLIFEIEKHSSISFIGGITLIFLIYICLVANLYTAFILNSTPFRNIYLILFSFGFLLASFWFIKRSKKFELTWNLHLNLFKNKKKNYTKNNHPLEKRLLG